jgi:hypothetical protein
VDGYEGKMSRRIFHIEPDQQALEVLDLYDLDRVPTYDKELFEPVLRDVLEALAARGLAPESWTHEDRVEFLLRSSCGAKIALKNPRALMTAEGLLSDAIEAAHAESNRREVEDAARGAYVGIRSWEQLCGKQDAGDLGRLLPSGASQGFKSTDHPELDRAWLESTRDTGSSWGSVGEHVWRAADQILSGEEWVTSLYETGFGLWCWKEEWGAPEWALIVHPGDGFPWPVSAKDHAK